MKFFLLFSFVSLTLELSAQNTIIPVTAPLEIGDYVPDVEFQNLVNYTSSSVRLSEFKGKLVILDFWATWCSACLQHFPLLDSLQKSLKDSLQIMLINSKATGDGKEKVKEFFNKSRRVNGTGYHLPSAVEDTVMDALFPHSLIPHYIWIDGNRRIVAITSSDQVNAENIHRAIKQEPIKFRMKRDQDRGKPIFSSDDFPVDNLLAYSVLLKGWFPGLPSGSHGRTTGGIITGAAFTNTCLFNIYQNIAFLLIPGFSNRQMILQIRDSSDFIPDTVANSQEKWYKEHSYSLDFTVQVSMADSLYPLMLESLNRYSGYTGRIQKEKMKCFALKVASEADALHNLNKGNNRVDSCTCKQNFHAHSVSDIINYLDKHFHVQVFDETNFRQAVDITLPDSPTNLFLLKDCLKDHGFILMEAEKEMEMFIITNHNLN